MPSLGMMTINALVTADSVVIPCEPSYLSVKGLDLLMHSIARIKRQINPGLKIDGILMTMVDYRTVNARDVSNALRESIGINIKVFNTEIPRSVRAQECANLGKSIFEHDPNGKWQMLIQD
jgi:chromosome partitioning protein